LARLAGALDPDRDAGLAINLMRRAVALDPQGAAGHLELGEALQAAGRFDEAVACHRRAITLDPARAAAFEHMGKALFAAGREAEAVAPFRLLAAVSPTDPLPWTWLEGLWRAQSRIPEADRAMARERELRGPGERPPRRSVVIPVLDYSPGSPFDIRSLLDDLADFDGEVIVVFNDEAMFQDLGKHPRIDKFAHNRHNVGVARAWNIGINHAEGEVVFVLNADLHILPGTLARLEAYLFELPDAVMVAPGGDRVEAPRFHATARWSPGTFAEPVEVDRVHGFLFALHAQRFHDAGLCFDPRMSPYFHEETDIGLKARAAGLKTWAVPVTGFEHVWGITRADRKITYFGRPVDRAAMLVRNGLILRERVRRTGK
ncbi:MAG: glycosyltransferase, partial [Alphaproteobacteria bacterium]|nr:glycosyltransferase [Alphaproteobacteria bacterium]